MKVKIVLSIVALFFFALIIGLISLRNELDKPINTVILDRNGRAVFENSRWADKQELPGFMLDYFESEVNLSGTSKMLYPTQKVKGSISSMMLQTLFTDKEVLEIYTNKLYFDNGLIGVENASQYYFNKSIKDTTKLEQIFLLFKSQNDSSSNYKMDMELFMGYLINQRYLNYREFARLTPQIPEMLEKMNRKDTASQSYIGQIVKEVNEVFAISEEEVFRRGYVIHSNLDRKLQNRLYEIFQEKENFLKHENTFVEGSMTIMEHQTGKVIGLIGGREYYQSGFNRATETTRQPASAFKPLIVYGPAIENGWKPGDVLKDAPMKFGDFKPKNYDYKFREQVSLKEALTMSYNVPAAWLLYQIGFKQGLEYVKRFDLFQIDPRDGYKLALGFTSVGTSPLAMAQAYTAFPNGGKMISANTIGSIKSKEGDRIYTARGREKRIFKKETAEVMTALLKNVVENGTGDSAQIKGREIAGKTGTTSYDGWFVGFDQKYVGAVWLGPDEVIPDNRMVLDDQDFQQKLFKKVFIGLE